MDIELKEKIDNLMNELSNLSDLNQKMELFHYILRQAFPRDSLLQAELAANSEHGDDRLHCDADREGSSEARRESTISRPVSVSRSRRQRPS